MRYFFSLQISASSEQADRITNILGVVPNHPLVSWGYKLIVKDNTYTNFIDIFLGILEGRYEKLQDIGITKDDITIWMIYEYEEQCNMEFTPNDMKRLGDSGVTFCISCYKSSNSKS